MDLLKIVGDLAPFLASAGVLTLLGTIFVAWKRSQSTDKATDASAATDQMKISTDVTLTILNTTLQRNRELEKQFGLLMEKFHRQDRWLAEAVRIISNLLDNRDKPESERAEYEERAVQWLAKTLEAD